MRLLVADDNRDLADTLAQLLRRQGFDVDVAYDGGQAVQLAVSFSPDVLILDLSMPVMSGFEVAQRLRTRPEFAQKVFVALTGYSDQAHLDEASQAEFDDYLVKPIAPRVLLDVLTDARQSIGD